MFKHRAVKDWSIYAYNTPALELGTRWKVLVYLESGRSFPGKSLEYFSVWVCKQTRDAFIGILQEPLLTITVATETLCSWRSGIRNARKKIKTAVLLKQKHNMNHLNLFLVEEEIMGLNVRFKRINLWLEFITDMLTRVINLNINWKCMISYNIMFAKVLINCPIYCWKRNTRS